MIVVTIMNEKKTPNTIYRYSLRIRGLLFEKSKFLVLFIIEALELRLDVEEIDDTLAERPPTPLSLSFKPV